MLKRHEIQYIISQKSDSVKNADSKISWHFHPRNCVRSEIKEQMTGDLALVGLNYPEKEEFVFDPDVIITEGDGKEKISVSFILYDLHETI